jgi:hypothetical protein
MTKPHEEEWYQSSPGTVRVRNDRNSLVGGFASIRREKLAASAPRMARALLMWLSGPGNHTDTCGSERDDESACSTKCAATRAALRDGGVL